MDGDIIRIIVHEVFEAYDSDNHYDDYESLRRNLEDAGVSDAWERDIDSDLKAARDTIETALALLDRIEALEQERDAARGEAERWKQLYEALMAEMESVAQDLRKRAYSCAKDWLETGHHYHDGASDAYYEAGLMVRRLLAEAG